MVTPGARTAMSNTDFTATYLGLGNNVTLPNGTSVENGNIDVTVNTSDGSISGSFTSNDSGAAQDSASFTSLTFDQSTYGFGSSQSDLLANGGNYGFQFNLPGTGTITGTLQLTASSSDTKTDNMTGLDTLGCTYTGTAVVIDTHYNAYDVTRNRTCSGSSLALTGIGAFYPAGVIAPANTFGMLLDDGASVAVEIVAQ